MPDPDDLDDLDGAFPEDDFLDDELLDEDDYADYFGDEDDLPDDELFDDEDYTGPEPVGHFIADHGYDPVLDDEGEPTGYYRDRFTNEIVKFEEDDED